MAVRWVFVTIRHRRRDVHLPLERTDEPSSHEDPEKLAAGYADYDSFAEMRETLGVDAGVQTVRKQMSNHGSHVSGGRQTAPSPDDTDSDSAAGEAAAHDSAADSVQPDGSVRDDMVDDTPSTAADEDLPSIANCHR